jgi:NTP pyrophosphatase (non-canonical NTP hydrolase)
MSSTKTLQQSIFANKAARGFNTTDVPLEICLLQAEVSEFFDAWRRQEPGQGEELADVGIFLLGIAEMAGVDLGEEIDRKLAINAGRTYKRSASGVMLKVER